MDGVDMPQLIFKLTLFLVTFVLPLVLGVSVKWTPAGSFVVIALLLWPWQRRNREAEPTAGVPRNPGPVIA